MNNNVLFLNNFPERNIALRTDYGILYGREQRKIPVPESLAYHMQNWECIP